MRTHPQTGRAVPETLGDLLRYVKDELDPRLVGDPERKADVVQAVEAMIDHTKGGASFPLRRDVDIDSMIGQLLVKSVEFARARIRQAIEENGPSDLLIHISGLVIQTGDRKRIRHFAEQLRAALRDPTVHPSKHGWVKKFADWVEMHAKGNC